MESVTGNRTLTFVKKDLTLAPVLLIAVPGFIAIFTIYVTVKIFLKIVFKVFNSLKKVFTDFHVLEKLYIFYSLNFAPKV